MKKLLIFCFCFLAIEICHGESFREEIFGLWNKIGEFEKRVPFFTKSKATIFFSFDSTELNGSFYGIYLNDTLINTGTINVEKVYKGKGFLIGDFPVRTGQNIFVLKLYKNGSEISKKFEIDMPEFRRIALEFLFQGGLSNLKIVPRAWLVE
jgi:hypothetical protein